MAGRGYGKQGLRDERGDPSSPRLEVVEHYGLMGGRKVVPGRFEANTGLSTDAHGVGPTTTAY